MLRALATAATGMEAQQTQIEVIANNLSNVNTTAFKASRAQFQDLLYQNLRIPGANTAGGTLVPSGVQVGLGTRLSATTRTNTEGDMQQTGGPLDVAIEGDGFFSVTLPSGEVAYTRSGALQTDANGHLVTQDGYSLTGGVTIPPNASSVTINADGTVSVQEPNQTALTQVGQLTLTNFPNPVGLLALGRNLYRATSISGTPMQGTPGTQGLGTLSQGFLEGSNVQVVNEMVNMIVAQRAYEVDSRVIKAADEMLGQTAQLH